MAHTPDQLEARRVAKNLAARKRYAARKKAAAKKPAPKKPVVKKPATPIVDNIPTTPGEIKDAAAEVVDRAKDVGITPFVEAAGTLASRFFRGLNDFFDGVENKKKDGG